MTTYVRLIKFTTKGANTVKDFAARKSEARRIMEANGAKSIATYVTLGSYDMVSVIEAPDDKTALKISAAISALGNLTAETLPAVTAEEFEKLVK